MYTKILVPLDGSELSEAVLPHVRTIAKCMDAEVLLVRVPVVLPYDYNIVDPDLIASLLPLGLGAAYAVDRLARLRLHLPPQFLLLFRGLRSRGRAGHCRHGQNPDKGTQSFHIHLSFQ